MKSEREMERMLGQVIVPTLRDGPHRDHLKKELLDSSVGLRRKAEKPWILADRFGGNPLGKTAACLLLAALLFSSGWAAEKAYQWVATKSQVVELERFDTPAVTLPEGSGESQVSMSSVTVVGTTISADATSRNAETVKQQHNVVKKLIAAKEYKFIKAFEHSPGSQKEYLYRFTLPDGEQLNMNFSMRLEHLDSWEDYVNESKKQAAQRSTEISKAIAAGSFRLLDVKPITTHVCQDVGASQKLMVLRVELNDGKEVASILGDSVNVQHQTSWQEHIESIRRGDRVLLDLKIVRAYTYEITLQNGTKTIFTYSGEGALKKPQG